MRKYRPEPVAMPADFDERERREARDLIARIEARARADEVNALLADTEQLIAALERGEPVASPEVDRFVDRIADSVVDRLSSQLTGFNG